MALNSQSVRSGRRRRRSEDKQRRLRILSVVKIVLQMRGGEASAVLCENPKRKWHSPLDVRALIASNATSPKNIVTCPLMRPA